MACRTKIFPFNARKSGGGCALRNTNPNQHEYGQVGCCNVCDTLDYSFPRELRCHVLVRRGNPKLVLPRILTPFDPIIYEMRHNLERHTGRHVSTLIVC